MNKGAFYTGQYRNVFAELGYDEHEIEARKNAIFQTLFYGDEDERLYHPVGEGMANFEDTGNHDARTEGMSYAMMFCVQLDKKAEFDRLWRWARTYMYLTDGPNAGYFAWSCGLDGTKNAQGAAPDGEEYFAMALLFAANRWGCGEGILDYRAEARALLHTCLHKGENGGPGRAMWDPENHLIRFIAEADFSDPSYHLPHFYALFALWADEADRPFWRSAAAASRAYLKKVCHPVTGLCAEYADYEGKPQITPPDKFGGRHDWYYSDAYRTIANIALDAVWFGGDAWSGQEAARLQAFFCGTVCGNDRGIYEVDGTLLPGRAMHPVAMTATNAEASLAAPAGPNAEECVRRFWDTPLRTGPRRYYDNCLYLFAFLALSGSYRIYIPKSAEGEVREDEQ